MQACYFLYWHFREINFTYDAKVYIVATAPVKEKISGIHFLHMSEGEVTNV